MNAASAPDRLTVYTADGAVSLTDFPGAEPVTYRRSKGAMLARGQSNTVVGTPAALISAVENRFGPLAVDLAATAENAKASVYLTPEDDSLPQDWAQIAAWYPGHLFLNPPYNNITPWAGKCRATAPALPAGQSIFLLVPSSHGAKWWRENCAGYAYEYRLGRIRFDGYPAGSMKDHSLLAFGRVARDEYEYWTDWLDRAATEHREAYRR